MTTRIVVPHRGLAAAKTRLASVLDPTEREALALRLLQRVLRVTTAAVEDVVVISPDPGLAEVVAACGARLSVQHGMGLNNGLAQACREALADGVTTLLVLHGDLPNLHPDDIVALLGAAAGGSGVAIAPDRLGVGTNGLALLPPDAIGFQFGPGSFAAHLADARQRGLEPSVVERPGLAFDLDTPDDLARWLRLGDAA